MPDELLTQLLPDPNLVGQSEYRAVHELLIESVPFDTDGDRNQTLRDALAMLDEVDGATKLMRERITAQLQERADRAPNDLTDKPVAEAADYLTGLTQDGCTGHLEVVDGPDFGARHIVIHHDGDSCPIHEPGDTSQ